MPRTLITVALAVVLYAAALAEAKGGRRCRFGVEEWRRLDRGRRPLTFGCGGKIGVWVGLVGGADRRLVGIDAAVNRATLTASTRADGSRSSGSESLEPLLYVGLPRTET